MGLFKTALIGAAVYGAIKYITKKDVNGRSLVDDFKEKAPEWVDKAKRFKEDVAMDYKNRADSYSDIQP